MSKKLVSVILYSFCVTTFVICALVYIPLLIIFGPDKSTWFRRLYGYLMIRSTFNRLVVINQPPLDGGPYLFVINHQSMFDGFMLAVSLPYHFSAIVKKEAFAMPLFGFIIGRLGLISIDRKDHRDSIDGLNKAVEKIKSGVSIIIFPEGTRTKNGQVGSFKKGAFRIALDSEVTIVPVGIIGSYKSQPTGTGLLKPGILKINFGQPLPYSSYQNLSINQLSDLVREQIIELSSNP